MIHVTALETRLIVARARTKYGENSRPPTAGYHRHKKPGRKGYDSYRQVATSQIQRVIDSATLTPRYIIRTD